MDGEHKFETFSMDLKKNYIQIVLMMATMRKLIWADVSVYEGFWKSDKAHGFGIYIKILGA